VGVGDNSAQTLGNNLFPIIKSRGTPTKKSHFLIFSKKFEIFSKTVLTGEFVSSLEGHKGEVSRVVWMPSGQRLEKYTQS
jgi:hypothetical protein